MEKAECRSEYFDDILLIEVSGEIDHHSAKILREKIDRELFMYKAKNVYLDLAEVNFMDSSGLGLILGRYTKVTELGGKLKISNPSPEVSKLLKLAGTEKMIQIERFNEKLI